MADLLASRPYFRSRTAYGKEDELYSLEDNTDRSRQGESLELVEEGVVQDSASQSDSRLGCFRPEDARKRFLQDPFPAVGRSQMRQTARACWSPNLVLQRELSYEYC